MDDKTAAFTQFLWRGAPYSYYWRDRDKHSQWFDVFPPSECTLGETGIHIGIHPSRTKRAPTVDAPSPHARLEDIAVINCLFADHDAKDFGGSLEAVKAHLLSLPVQPQIILYTGGGFHSFWLIADPVEVCDATREYLTGTQRGWANWSGSDPGMRDLAHSSRLPGSTNPKYSPPRKVQFMRFNYTGLESELYNFNTLCNIADDWWPESFTLPVVEPVFAGNNVPSIRGLVDAMAGAKNGNRNNLCFWCANRMFDQGLSAESVMGELQAAAESTGMKRFEIAGAIKSAQRQKRSPIKPSPGRPYSGAKKNARPMSLDEAHAMMQS